MIKTAFENMDLSELLNRLTVRESSNDCMETIKS